MGTTLGAPRVVVLVTSCPGNYSGRPIMFIRWWLSVQHIAQSRHLRCALACRSDLDIVAVRRRAVGGSECDGDSRVVALADLHSHGRNCTLAPVHPNLPLLYARGFERLFPNTTHSLLSQTTTTRGVMSPGCVWPDEIFPTRADTDCPACGPWRDPPSKHWLLFCLSCCGTSPMPSSWPIWTLWLCVGVAKLCHTLTSSRPTLARNAFACSLLPLRVLCCRVH